MPDDNRGRITKDGDPLTLVLGVAVNDPTSVAVANTAADQLRNVGIEASVLALDPVALYGDAVTQNRVDAIVGWHQAGGDLATALASRYGCRALEATAVSTDDRGCYRDVDAIADLRAPRTRRPRRHHDGDADDEKPGAGVGSSSFRRQVTSPASATGVSSRRSMRRCGAPRTSAR